MSVFGAPLALTFAAGAARADCAAPTPAIVWSYPAHGDTGVPTNVDLWVLPSDWGAPPRVTRDGVALTPLSLGYGFDAGELAPNTSYTFQIEVDTYGDTVPSFELTFTTGAGPAAPDPAAAPGDVVSSSSDERQLSTLCRAALATQDCFDTGQNTYYEFAPSGSAKGWIVSTNSTFRAVNVWPGECGPPVLLLHEYSPPCATLYGIDAAGALHEGPHVCAESATLTPEPGASGNEDPARPGSAPPDVATSPGSSNPSDAASRGSATTPVPASSSSGCSIGDARRTSGRGATLGLAASLVLGMLIRGLRRRSPAAR